MWHDDACRLCWPSSEGYHRLQADSSEPNRFSAYVILPFTCNVGSILLRLLSHELHQTLIVNSPFALILLSPIVRDPWASSHPECYASESWM